MTGCPSDDGGGNETGTNTDGTSTGTPSTSSPSTTASTSSPSTTDEPTSSSSESGSSGEPTTTGNTDTDTDSASSSSTGAAVFAVTSPEFEQDGIIPSAHHILGDNSMPQLDWVGAPAGTMSFAVFFRDLTISFPHSAIWNISADATGTPFDPEHVPMPRDPAGSVQCRNWAADNDDLAHIPDYGYGGPGSNSNTYEFEVYALDVADLSGEIDQDSSIQEVEAAFEAHVIESVTISGQTEGAP
jgi:phosphatidylethanolamine-binding protein (PEBP) family uncharacterized protein